MPVAVLINGPNLNRLGRRQPEIYGATTLAEIEALVTARAAELGWTVVAFQSNHEGAIIDRIHAAEDEGAAGLIINPGALTHYSHAVADALRGVAVPAVEVHLSDIESREEWRRQSVTRDACVGFFAGQGPRGYTAALELLAERAAAPAQLPAEETP